MKKVALLFATVCLWGFSQAQESVIKLSGGDAAFGRYEISYERTFNEGMNNIKSSGKMRSQKAWPNILTKGSFQVSFSYISKKHSQVFGKGQIAVIDTNSNHHPQFDLNNPDHDDIRVNDDPNYHSIERSVVSTVSGIAFEGEYRSYIKTYKQNIGDAPRGWYIAPFFRFQTTTLDFDDNTAQEINWAMNRLMYGDNDVFNGYDGPWEGDEQTGTQIFFPNPNSIPDGLRWHDVSFKQTETVLAGGLAIGRQWLFGDKFSIDVQLGPQYKLVTRSERLFNGNDTWNMNQQANNVNNLTYPTEFYFFNKFGDVYDFEGDGADNEIANGYFGIVDENGTAVVINGKGDDTTLGYMTGFYRDLPGLTDFARIETYRLKVRIGYAF